MAAGDLTTLANAKTYCGVPADVTKDDVLLALIVTAASDAFKQFSGNQVLSASYTDRFDGDGSQGYTLRQHPATAVASVTVDDSPVPARPAIGQDGYVWDEQRVELVGYSFSPGLKNCVVQYTAGYATTPAIVELAVLEMVAWKYKRERAHAGQQSATVGGETVQFQVYDLPAGVKAVIKRYERTNTP